MINLRVVILYLALRTSEQRKSCPEGPEGDRVLLATGTCHLLYLVIDILGSEEISKSFFTCISLIAKDPENMLLNFLVLHRLYLFF